MYGQDIIIMVEDNIIFYFMIQAGYLEAVMLSGDNEGFQTQGSLLQFVSQSPQLPLLLLTASLQPLDLKVTKNEIE